jgi:hypothetical protein
MARANACDLQKIGLTFVSSVVGRLGYLICLATITSSVNQQFDYRLAPLPDSVQA